nr:hypothetical protein [Tanacetum cinerariifolium]
FRRYRHAALAESARDGVLRGGGLCGAAAGGWRADGQFALVGHQRPEPGGGDADGRGQQLLRGVGAASQQRPRGRQTPGRL